MFLRNHFFHSRKIPNFKMVDLQSTFNQGTTDYTETPTGAFRPIGKYQKKKNQEGWNL